LQKTIHPRTAQLRKKFRVATRLISTHSLCALATFCPYNSFDGNIFNDKFSHIANVRSGCMKICVLFACDSRALLKKGRGLEETGIVSNLNS
jgi:hypothetical protein